MKFNLPKLKMKFYNKVACYIVCGWAIFEILLCTIVLLSDREDHTNNFLYEFCGEKKCEHFIKKALICRIISSIILLLGTLMVIIMSII